MKIQGLHSLNCCAAKVDPEESGVILQRSPALHQQTTDLKSRLHEQVGSIQKEKTAKDPMLMFKIESRSQ